MNSSKPSSISRREFMEKMGIAIGSSAFLSSLSWLSPLMAQSTGNEKIRIGIIGPGGRGRFLMLHLLNIPGAEITAIADVYEPNLKRGIELTGGKAKGFNDYRKLLELKEIDAVVIATPLHLHAQMTIDAIDAGKHVFCEKSMARYYKDTYDMYQKAINSNKLLLIGHQRMFNLKYLKGIEDINNGKLGKIVQIRAYWHRNNDWRRHVPEPELERFLNWRLYHEYSCGLMTELASHQLQVANWILGEYPTQVSGSGSIVYWNDGREAKDNVNLVYSYKSGVHCNYDSVIANKLYGLEEEIQGNLGTMELEKGKYFPEELPPAPGILQLINNLEKQLFANIPLGGESWVPETASNTDGEYIIDKKLEDDGSALQMESFVQAVRENRLYRDFLKEAYYGSMAALMGFEAVEQNKIITFPEEYIV